MNRVHLLCLTLLLALSGAFFLLFQTKRPEPNQAKEVHPREFQIGVGWSTDNATRPASGAEANAVADPVKNAAVIPGSIAPVVKNTNRAPDQKLGTTSLPSTQANGGPAAKRAAWYESTNSVDGESQENGRFSRPNSSGTAPTTPSFTTENPSIGGASELPVPAGAVLPAAMVDPGESATQAEILVLDQISSDFINDINDSTAEISPTTSDSRTFPTPEWTDATREANERYRQLYGNDAFNSWTSNAAIDAMRDQ